MFESLKFCLSKSLMSELFSSINWDQKRNFYYMLVDLLKKQGAHRHKIKSIKFHIFIVKDYFLNE